MTTPKAPLKILLENLLRTEDGLNVKADDIAGLAQWDARAEPSRGGQRDNGKRSEPELRRRKP